MNDKKIIERTIKNNKKETLQKRIFLLSFLWLFGLFSFITIFGIDGNTKVCENCHKWGSVNWTLEKGKEEVQEIITENAFGKRQKTYKKTKYNNKIGICKCCKHKTIKETKQRI